MTVASKARYYEKNIDSILIHQHEFYLHNREHELKTDKARTLFKRQHTSISSLIEARRILQEMGLKS